MESRFSDGREVSITTRSRLSRQQHATERLPPTPVENAGATQRLVARIQPRQMLFVFLGYVVVSDARVAGALYLLDHIFFSLTIAMNSYFRHIARPQDISASAAVGFTINHVAAIVLPVTLGFVWLVSPGRVFLFGAGLALFSLFLSLLIPNNPKRGCETRLVRGSAIRQVT